MECRPIGKHPVTHEIQSSLLVVLLFVRHFYIKPNRQHLGGLKRVLFGDEIELSGLTEFNGLAYGISYADQDRASQAFGSQRALLEHIHVTL